MCEPRGLRASSLRVFLAGAALTGISCKGEEPLAPTQPVESSPALAAEVAGVAAFKQVSAGYDHTCGITTDSRTFCWGSGLLGNGSGYSQRVPPQLVAGGHHFRQVSSSHSHTCAITTDNRAYCWGSNGGRLGDGTTTDRLVPVAVGGGRQFRQVDAGTYHTCAVGYPDNRVYCWGGSNSNGELGDGTLTSRLTPVPVTGTRQFRQVTACWSHSCGVATSGAVFCWGSDRYGQMGDGSEITPQRSPHRISSGLLFRQIDAGAYHTCAVTTGSRAFCWGEGRFGEIGDGRFLRRFTPSAVAGALSFDRVTAGYSHTCGESSSNRAYCWGNNVYGALGDPAVDRRGTPGAVTGGLFFTQLSANGFHTCGVSSSSQAYCWGYNWTAQLGDGTIENRSTPTPVSGAN